MIDFNLLWDNHPGLGSKPCNFDNQCAIRMGVALENSGVNLEDFKGIRCWYRHSPRHILRAQELADWISEKTDLFGEKKVYKRKTYRFFEGKKGIVFIRDGWGATDHIDLWNGKELRGGYIEYLNRGIEIWFWELNNYKKDETI